VEWCGKTVMKTSALACIEPVPTTTKMRLSTHLTLAPTTQHGVNGVVMAWQKRMQTQSERESEHGLSVSRTTIDVLVDVQQEP
jgi:hypothetical protein